MNTRLVIPYIQLNSDHDGADYLLSADAKTVRMIGVESILV